MVGGVIIREKHKRFAEEYLIDLNATQAAVRAGYSPRSARSTGNALLKNPDIAKIISESAQLRLEELGITRERVLLEVARVAFFNIAGAIDWNTGQLRSDLSKEDLAALASIKVSVHVGSDGTTVSRQTKAMNKLYALNLLCKYFGLDKNRLSVGGSTPLVTFVGDEDMTD